MAKHDSVFYGAAFFLMGILAASAGLGLLVSLLLSLLSATVFILMAMEFRSAKCRYLAGLSVLLVIGSVYYWWDDARLHAELIPYEQKVPFRGTIVSDPEKGARQKFVLALAPPYSGKVLVRLNRYPTFNYGDVVSAEGRIEKAIGHYTQILAKDRILGTMSFPKLTFLSPGGGSPVKHILYGFKAKILDIFEKVLPPVKAAFLSGLTLGHRADFPVSLKEAMSLSGTTHLVALSGYNVSVIVVAVSATLGWFLKRRWQFFATVVFILAFVVMTGAEASIVRAAIMGIIMLLAQQTSRVYDFRNAITLAALAMALANPKVMLFDVGFQLSFFALLGIVYLRPALVKFFKIKEGPTWFGWRENLLTTASAQLAVIPILLANFGAFSLSSLAANVLILGAVPLTMVLGFAVAGFGLLSVFLAQIVAWLADLLLSYELAVIDLFSQLQFLMIATKNFGLLATLIYYGLIAGFVIYEHFAVKKT